MQFPGRSPSVVYGHAQSPTICARPGRAEYNTVIPPNSERYRWSLCKLGRKGSAPNEAQFINAQSYHPGGANFLFGDGSVRFLSDSIDMPIFQQLGHRSDGQLPNDGF